MKRLSLTAIILCCTMALTAQDGICVNYKGTTPTITDFAWAFLFPAVSDEEECGNESIAGFQQALTRHREGKPQEENVTFLVDERNGFIRYEMRYETETHIQEMCYWNEADGKHKLFAFNNMATLIDGKPVTTEYSGITFCRYNNATKTMAICDTPGFEIEYFNTTYALPQKGKDIILTKWDENGKKELKTLKWNGRQFK